MLASTDPVETMRAAITPTPRVEQDDAELLHGPSAVLRQQPLGTFARPQEAAPRRRGTQRSASQLDGRDDLRGAGNADSGFLTQVAQASLRAAR